MKLIIDIDEEIHEKIQSGEFWLSCGLNISNAYDFIKNGTPIPDNASNRDVIMAMTNFIGVQDEEDTIKISTSWWNSPYQKGGK